MTLPVCQMTEAILIVNIRDIISVVAMIPYKQSGEAIEGDEEHYFAMERPGLAVSHFLGAEGADDEDDKDDKDDNVE